MPTSSATGSNVGQSIDEQFLALVCSDEDLLRAEFDAIIAAEWPDPPMDTSRRGGLERRRASGGHRLPASPLPAPSASPRRSGIGGRAWQRAPPHQAASPRTAIELT
jgi:hypothetical protein